MSISLMFDDNIRMSYSEYDGEMMPYLKIKCIIRSASFCIDVVFL